MNKSKFRMGRLDHVHIRVPNREAAARWYAKHLGFEPVERFAFWAEGIESVRYWPRELCARHR